MEKYLRHLIIKKEMKAMRVKITAKEYAIEKLEFGKQYGMGYYGASFFDEFVFTRKNKIEQEK